MAAATTAQVAKLWFAECDTYRCNSAHVLQKNGYEWSCRLSLRSILKCCSTSSRRQISYAFPNFDLEESSDVSEEGLSDDGFSSSDKEFDSIPDKWSFQLEADELKASNVQLQRRLERGDIADADFDGGFLENEQMVMQEEHVLSKSNSLSRRQRAEPRNPRLDIGNATLKDVAKNLEEIISVQHRESETEDSKPRPVLTFAEKACLKKSRPDLSKISSHGASLLHYSIQTGSTNLVQSFIDCGVDVNSCDKYGWAPLHLAVLTGRPDIVKLLLDNGANKTLLNKDGLTPLDLCLSLGRPFNSIEVARVLKTCPKESTKKHF